MVYRIPCTTYICDTICRVSYKLYTIQHVLLVLLIGAWQRAQVRKAVGFIFGC